MARPREKRVDEAILGATRSLLVRDGYVGLTMENVSNTAGVGKAAIYRRFASKQEMVFAAVVEGSGLPVPANTGSLVGDLTGLAQQIIDQLTRPEARLAVLGLLSDIDGAPDLATRYREVFVSREQEVVSQVLARAVKRGELASMPDVAFVQALLTGPIFAVLYVQQGEPGRLAAQLGSVVANALTPGGPSRA